MFCRECGKHLIGSEDFCPMCGTKVIKEHEIIEYDQEEPLHNKSTAHQEQPEQVEEDFPPANSLHSNNDWQDEERYHYEDHASDSHESEPYTDDKSSLENHPYANYSPPKGQESELSKEHLDLINHHDGHDIGLNSSGKDEPIKKDENDYLENHPYASYNQPNGQEREASIDLKNHHDGHDIGLNSSGRDEPYKKDENDYLKNHPYANYNQSNSDGPTASEEDNHYSMDSAEKEEEVLPMNEFYRADPPQENQEEREAQSSHAHDPHRGEDQKRHETKELASASEVNQNNAQPKRKPIKKEWLLTIGIPAASLLLFTGTALAVQSTGKNANQKAEALHYEAEEYALDGSYEKAVDKLSEASKLRPENSVIKRVKAEVESALKVDKNLLSIEQKIDKKEFGEAKDALNSVRNDIQTRKSPIFAPLETKTSDQETALVVEMVKTETAEMDTVEEIGEQLKKIMSLKTAAAEEVKGQLIKKIVSISQKTSEEYMSKKNFDAAIAALRSGLKYTNYENVELTSRLSEIEDEKLSYSGSLPVFLERHWSVINSKAMRSKKPPLKIEKVTFEEDQFTYVVTGKLKSMTRSTLNNPTLYLKIYDKKGKFLFNEDVSSKEVAIKSGKGAEFFFFLDKQYGKEVKIVIDQVVYRK